MFKQIKDIAIIKTIAQDSDFLLMQNPSTGETYRITKANLLANFSSANTALMLDGLTNIVSARSTRKLLSSYMGKALDVQLTSGGATESINFTGADLDTASITSFANGNSAYVTKLYDQVSNINASQSTFSLCPKIVESGTIITAGTKPTLSYSSDYLTSAIPTGYPITIIAAIKISSTTKGAFIKCGITNGIGVGIGSGTIDSSGLNLIGLSENLAWIPSSSPISTSQMSIVEINSTGSSTNVYLNGSLVASGNSANAPTGAYYIGGYETRLPACNISEDIVFNQIVSPITRAKVVANMMNYYNIT